MFRPLAKLLIQITVNVIIKHHARSTYSSQTIRHVAERIDQMYQTRELEGDRGRSHFDDSNNAQHSISQESDLRLDEYVFSSPQIFHPSDIAKHEDITR